MSTAPAPPVPDLRGATSVRSRAARRPEVEGLRAVAIALVVGHHVWTGRVSGGVDVFLALTGFFLLGSLLRRVDTGSFGLPAVVEAWSRFAVRVLPAVALAVVGTLVMTAALLPPTRWLETVAQSVASVAMVQDRRLTDQAVDYLARGEGTSPLLHLWSVSIQAQVTLLLPLVVLLVLLAVRRSPRRARRAVVVVTALLAVASFARSVVLTAADQAYAYVDASSRVWELALGGLAGVMLATWRPSAPAALVLGWLGLAALVATGFVVPPTAFPGTAAALPVLAGLLVVAAGGAGGRLGVHRLLRARVLVRAARLSLPLYLWHWPVLVCYLHVTGRTTATAVGGVGVVALSTLLAVLADRVVEGRLVPSLRRRPPGTAACAAVAVAASAALVASGWGAWLEHRARLLADEARPGALVLDPASTAAAPVGPLVPSPVDLWIGWPDSDVDELCSHEALPDRLRVCSDGRSAARRVVVVGDSHAVQWVTPLRDLAEELDMSVSWVVAGGCRLRDPAFFEEEEDACRVWNRRVVEEVLALSPSLVVTTATEEVRPGGGEVPSRGLAAQARRFVAAGVPVLAMRDNPRYAARPTECVLDTDDPATCSTPTDAVYTQEALAAAVAALPTGTTVVDTRDYWCGATTCDAVVGGLYVYVDDNHITVPYMRSTVPLLERDLRAATGW